jgi:hypothetical protein
LAGFWVANHDYAAKATHDFSEANANFSRAENTDRFSKKINERKQVIL